MHTLFLGTRSAQSTATLAELLACGAAPEAVLLHTPSQGRRSIDLPVTAADQPPGSAELAARHGIPVYPCPEEKLTELIHQLSPEQVLVSCYPRRIDSELLTYPPAGWLNIHPSALPAYQGPSPIFWQLRDGRDKIGVTLHRMSPQIDRGPILGQAYLPLSAETAYDEINREAGRLGAQLFRQYMQSAPAEAATRPTPAADQPGSYQGFPTADDFLITPDWGVERAYRFIKGVKGFGYPTIIDNSGEKRLVKSILSWHTEVPSIAGERELSVFSVTLADGWVRLTA